MTFIRYIKFIFTLSILTANADHLVFSRITIQPTEAEFISIYNPTSEAVDLADYYISDATKSSSQLKSKYSDYNTEQIMIIEAKLLGCKLILNDNVQHKEESWFETRESIYSYMRERTSVFCW